VYARISGAIDWIEDQVCSLSDNPPNDCGRSGPRPPRPNTRERIRVDVLYDNHPEDTGWSILTDSLDTVAESELGSVEGDNVLVSTYVDLDHGAYFFQILDSFGDGLSGGELRDGPSELVASGESFAVLGFVLVLFEPMISSLTSVLVYVWIKK
jgi:hypothetical protein